MGYRRQPGEDLRRDGADVPWRGDRSFHSLVLAAMVVAIAVLYLTDSLVREVIFACLAAATIPAMAIGMRVNRVAYRLPWRLALTAMCFLSVGNAWQVMRIVRHTNRTFGQPVMQVVMLIAYLALLAGSLLLVLRRAPRDRGRVIEAALVGLVGAGLLWEVVLRPRLDARMSPIVVKAVVLVQVLTLLAVLGALLKVVRIERRGRGSLSYMFLAIFATLTNVLFTTLTPIPGGGQLRGVVTGIWTVAYFSLAAAVLHPGVAVFSGARGGSHRADLSPVRLAYLGAALWASPMLGVVPVVLHRPADVLLLFVGPLLIIPLVLVRISQIVAERIRDQQALAYQAAHDDLTGLPNRRAFFQFAEEALRGPERISILYCDLDGFKPINDSFGHRAGDEVLRTIARRLRECVGADDVVGRVGGDEFLILTRGASEPECHTLARRVEDGCQASIPVDGAETRVGVTVGYAISDRLVRPSADALVAAADQAMYERKRSKRHAALT